MTDSTRQVSVRLVVTIERDLKQIKCELADRITLIQEKSWWMGYFKPVETNSLYEYPVCTSVQTIRYSSYIF